MVSITDNSYAQLPVQCTYIREFVLRRYLHITNMDGYILIPTICLHFMDGNCTTTV